MAKRKKNSALISNAQSENANFYEADSFGALFRNLRKDAGLSLDRLADLTKINKQYLLYLENEEFSKLPPAVYSRGFIIRCAKFLKESENETSRQMIPDKGAAKLLHLYAKQTHQNSEITQGVTRNTAGFFRFFIGPQQLTIFAISFFFFLVVLFLGVKFTPFFFEPDIQVLEPAAENLVVNFSKVSLGGRAIHASSLTLNDEKVYIGENGVFSKEADLNEGVNRIVFRAKNIFGRTKEVVKRVVYIKN